MKYPVVKGRVARSKGKKKKKKKKRNAFLSRLYSAFLSSVIKVNSRLIVRWKEEKIDNKICSFRTGNSDFRGVSRFEIEMFLAGGRGGISFQVLPPETFEQSSHCLILSRTGSPIFSSCASLRSRRRLVVVEKKNTRNALHTENDEWTTNWWTGWTEHRLPASNASLIHIREY